MHIFLTKMQAYAIHHRPSNFFFLHFIQNLFLLEPKAKVPHSYLFYKLLLKSLDT